MKKYRFFGNRKTFGPHKEEHPSIEIGINNGKWENIEITSSPTKNEKFTAFDENPNPNWRGKDENGKPLKPSYFRNYLRKDSIKDRLNEYSKYSLIESDECKIDKFLEERQRNIELDNARRKAAIKRKQQKNDAKLRYQSSGRSASRRVSAQASSRSIKAINRNRVKKKR